MKAGGGLRGLPRPPEGPAGAKREGRAGAPARRAERGGSVSAPAFSVASLHPPFVRGETGRKWQSLEEAAAAAAED